jgi:cytochrome c biogenesis protein CcmG/thiol:disulfide interchange protein DsbE
VIVPPSNDDDRDRRWRVLLTVVAVAALFAALGLIVVRPSVQTAGSQIGTPAPDFTLSSIGGGTPVRLDRLRGQVVVLNFWASWCTPCRTEAPTLADAYMQWHIAPVMFVGVLYQDEPTAAQAFARREGIVYPLVNDPGAKIAGEYGVSGVPETVIVSAAGVIVHHAYGAVTGQELNSWLRGALAEGTASVEPSAGSSSVR